MQILQLFFFRNDKERNIVGEAGSVVPAKPPVAACRVLLEFLMFCMAFVERKTVVLNKYRKIVRFARFQKWRNINCPGTDDSFAGGNAIDKNTGFIGNRIKFKQNLFLFP